MCFQIKDKRKQILIIVGLFFYLIHSFLTVIARESIVIIIILSIARIIIISILGAVPYYYNPKIHSLGNIGVGGKIHAFTAPFARRMIDHISYKGVNIRKDIMSEYRDNTVLDLCCGIGDSTPKFATGIDTSKEMINMAN